MINYNKISVNESNTEEENDIIDDEATIEETTIEEEIVDVRDKCEGVINCKLLNVRPEKGTDNDPVAIVDEGTKVEIDLSDSDNGWLHIYLISGVEGYVMEKFVTF